MDIEKVVENIPSCISRHDGSSDLHIRYIWHGIRTTPNDKSLKNKVRNNIWDELNLFCLILVIPVINKTLAPIINGIKLAYIPVNKGRVISESMKRNTEKHSVYPLSNRSVVLFMVRPKKQIENNCLSELNQAKVDLTVKMKS